MNVMEVRFFALEQAVKLATEIPTPVAEILLMALTFEAHLMRESETEPEPEAEEVPAPIAQPDPEPVPAWTWKQ